MTSKPHDALFKAGFEAPERAAGVFRTILPPALVAAIEWSSLTRVAGSFIDPALGDRHTDLLFSAQVQDCQLFLYLLLEHQSTSDPNMPLRLLIYLVRIWEQYRKQHRKQHPSGPLPFVIPVVVSNARGGWTAPVAFHDLFEPSPGSIPGLERLVPQFSFLLEDLSTLDDDALALWAIDSFSKLVLWALRDARDMPTLIEKFHHWAETFRDALASPNGMEAIGQFLRYVFLVGGSVYYEEFHATMREQLPEAEDAMETIADWLRKEGRKEGRKELFMTLLRSKFGELEPAHLDRVQAASDDLLERYIQHFVAAETLDAVFEA